MTRLRRSTSDPIREHLDWEGRWGDLERALVTAWETGRLRASSDSDLATRARSGELIPLAWRGGIERRTKQSSRYGCLQYLAMWRGLRGEDLDIRTDEEVTITCSRTGMPVTFTFDVEKYKMGD